MSKLIFLLLFALSHTSFAQQSCKDLFETAMNTDSSIVELLRLRRDMLNTGNSLARIAYNQKYKELSQVLSPIELNQRMRTLSDQLPRIERLETAPIDHRSRQERQEDFLIEFELGIKIDDLDSNNRNALHIATDKNNKEIISILIRRRPEYIHGKDQAGDTPALIAARNGNIHTVIDLLKNGASPLATNNNGANILDHILTRPVEIKTSILDQAFTDIVYSIQLETLLFPAAKDAYTGRMWTYRRYFERHYELDVFEKLAKIHTQDFVAKYKLNIKEELIDKLDEILIVSNVKYKRFEDGESLWQEFRISNDYRRLILLLEIGALDTVIKEKRSIELLLNLLLKEKHDLIEYMIIQNLVDLKNPQEDILTVAIRNLNIHSDKEAARKSLVLILKSNIDINEQAKRHNSDYLFYISRLNDIELIDLLIAKGIDVSFKKDWGISTYDALDNRHFFNKETNRHLKIILKNNIEQDKAKKSKAYKLYYDTRDKLKSILKRSGDDK